MDICIYRSTGPALKGSNAPILSAEQLARTVAAYSPGLHEAPVGVGKPTSESPAFAWVRGLRATSDALFAELHQVCPAFDAMRRDGRFSHLAATFYSPEAPLNPVLGVWSLRNVVFFGAPAPMVKGLRTSQFCDEARDVFSFNYSEGGLNMSSGGRAPHVSLPAGAAIDPGRMALHKKIASYAEANGIDYAVAATLVERDVRQGPASYAELADGDRAALHRKIELYAAKYGVSYKTACSAIVAAMQLEISPGSMPANLPLGAAVDPARAAMHNKIASHAEAKGIDYASALSELSHTLGA